MSLSADQKIEIAIRAIEGGISLLQTSIEALRVQDPADLPKVTSKLTENSIKLELLKQELIAASPIEP